MTVAMTVAMTVVIVAMDAMDATAATAAPAAAAAENAQVTNRKGNLLIREATLCFPRKNDLGLRRFLIKRIPHFRGKTKKCNKNSV